MMSNDEILLMQTALKNQVKAGFRPDASKKLLEKFNYIADAIEHETAVVSAVQLAAYIIAYAAFKKTTIRGNTVEAIAYIIQGEHLAHFGKPLFPEKFTTGRYGVSCKEISDEVMGRFWDLTKEDTNFEMLLFQSLLSDEKLNFIDKILKQCFRQNTQFISSTASNTTPVFKRLTNENTYSKEIPNDEIKEYFMANDVFKRMPQ